MADYPVKASNKHWNIYLDFMCAKFMFTFLKKKSHETIGLSGIDWQSSKKCIRRICILLS